MSQAFAPPDAPPWRQRLDPRHWFDDVAPADVWPDTGRMAVACALAALATTALHLRGGYWAVLIAMMITRPTAAGGLSAVGERLLGMAVGITVGLALVGARRWGVPEQVLIACAMLPVCFLVVRFRRFQAAPISAIIVISAGMGAAAVHAVESRIAQILLGAAIGLVVSALLFRRTTDRRSRVHAANMLRGCGQLMVLATRGSTVRRDQLLRHKVRGELRMVMVTSRALRSHGRALRARHLAGFTRLHTDLACYGRALTELRPAWRNRLRPVLDRLADAFEALCRQCADYLIDAAPAPDLRTYDAGLQALRAAMAERDNPRPDEVSAALPLLLAHLRSDLATLIDGYGDHPDLAPLESGDVFDAEPFGDLALAPR